jgi:hypothetical protein
MVVVSKLLASLNLLLSVVQALIDDFLGLSPPLEESLFESGDAWGVDEDEAAIDLVIVDLLPSLDINIQQADLTIIPHVLFLDS